VGPVGRVGVEVAENDVVGEEGGVENIGSVVGDGRSDWGSVGVDDGEGSTSSVDIHLQGFDG